MHHQIKVEEAKKRGRFLMKNLPPRPVLGEAPMRRHGKKR